MKYLNFISSTKCNINCNTIFFFRNGNNVRTINIFNFIKFKVYINIFFFLIEFSYFNRKKYMINIYKILYIFAIIFKQNIIDFKF